MNEMKQARNRLLTLAGLVLLCAVVASTKPEGLSAWANDPGQVTAQHSGQGGTPD